MQDEVLGGPGDLTRLTIVDAEASSVQLLIQLSQLPGHMFITVWKGNGASKIVLESPEEWQPYRGHDRIRRGRVHLKGKSEDDKVISITLYAVEMERENSRHPHRTLFVTDATVEQLSAPDVVNAYLSRWPNQEGVFREARNGAGLDRSHGFGGEYVTHVAFPTKFEDAENRVLRAQQKDDEAKEQLERAKQLAKSVKDEEQKQAARDAVKQAQTQSKARAKALVDAQKNKANMETMPREIFQRDTTRENISTALTTMVMLLIEWVLREYFGDLKVELRTFLEHFLYVPTEKRTSARRILHRLETADLPPERAEQLSKACAEVTRRKLRKFGRLLVFETVPKLGGQSP